MSKSLEHTIRSVVEGKEKADNKKSLEHAIRDMKNKKEYESSYAAKDSRPIDEDVGGLIGSGTGGEPKLHTEDGKKKKTDESVGMIGTDKFQGNQFKSVKTSTPHIEPPGMSDTGHGHSQKPENVSRQRTLAKEKTSMTMQGKVNEEDNLNEFLEKAGLEAGKLALKGAREVFKTWAKGEAIKSLTKKEPSELDVPIQKPLEVYPKKPSLPAVKEPAPLPATKPQVKPAEVPTLPKPQVEPATTPKPAEVPTLPKTAPAPEPAPAPKPAEPPTLPKTKIDTGTRVKPGPKVGPEPGPAPGPGPKPKEPTGPRFRPPPDEEPGKKKIKLPAYGSYTPKPVQLSGPHAPVHTSVSKFAPIPVHKNVYREETEDRKEIENMPRSGDRKKIEYVGRKLSNPKTDKERTSRQAELKNKIISEGKKLASTIKKAKKEKMEDANNDGKQRVYPQVIVNPDLKRVDLNIDNGGPSKDYVNQ